MDRSGPPRKVIFTHPSVSSSSSSSASSPSVPAQDSLRLEDLSKSLWSQDPELVSWALNRLQWFTAHGILTPEKLWTLHRRELEASSASSSSAAEDSCDASGHRKPYYIRATHGGVWKSQSEGSSGAGMTAVEDFLHALWLYLDPEDGFLGDWSTDLDPGAPEDHRWMYVRSQSAARVSRLIRKELWTGGAGARHSLASLHNLRMGAMTVILNLCAWRGGSELTAQRRTTSGMTPGQGMEMEEEETDRGTASSSSSSVSSSSRKGNSLFFPPSVP